MDNQQTELYYRNHPAARLTVLIVVCISAFLTPLSLSGSLVAVPAMSAALHIDAIYASWIPAAFLLSNLLCMLPSGRLADLYGRKRIFLWGGVVFALGSLLIAVTTNLPMLLLCRVIQGIGSAMFFTTGIAIIGGVYEAKQRGAALGWLVSAVYLGLTCGPLFGGWVTEAWGWKAIFLLPIPLVLMVLLATTSIMKGEWRSATPERLDVLGVLYLSISIGSLFMASSSLPSKSAAIWLVVGVVFMWVFVRHCATVPSPLVRLNLVFGSKLLSKALSASIMVYASNYGMIFLLSLYLQYNRGMSPTQAGQILMVQALVMACLAPVAGRLSDRYRPRLLATLGCISMACGLFLLLPFLNTHTPYALIIVALIAFGVGFGLFSTPNSNGVLSSVSPDKMGMASALLNLSRLLGQMIGTAVVTLLMSLTIGKLKITPELYDSLLQVVRWMVAISLGFALTAAYFSWEKSPKLIKQVS